jgi:flagellin
MASFSVVTNIGALKAHDQLVATERNLHSTLTRMSSGLRINGAQDDAAGLAIAENLRADVAGLNQAIRNANDGLSVINVADTAMNEIANLLHRAVTLAQQASSDTSGTDGSASKEAINAEYNQILDEIDRIAGTVEYNGTLLLSNSGASLDVQIGLSSSANDRITITTPEMGTSDMSLSTDQLLTKSAARQELVRIQDAIENVAAKRGLLGASYNRLEHTIEVITVQAESLTASESQIRDADMAKEIVNLTKYQVLNQSGMAALGQANAASQSVLSLLG